MAKKSTAKRNFIASVLAMSLSASMLVGTTFAWFTDSASSKNNVIKTGTLDLGMYWTDTFGGTWMDVEADNTPAIYDNENWEPGYTDVKYVKIANEGSLSFQYELNVLPNGEVGKLAEVIDVYLVANATKAVTKKDVADATPNGTFQDLIDGVITLDGTLLAGEEAVSAIVLQMRDNAGNEYQNQSIGDSFELRVLATQYTYEEDSFDKDYDAGAIIPPKAVVKTFDKEELTAINTAGFYGYQAGEVVLETAYSFTTTDTFDEAQAETYKYWHVDYVVSFDKDVAANTVGLAGYYESWCSANTNNQWVAIPVDQDVAANTPVRLLETAGGSMNYEELCLLVQEFQCGAFNLSEDNYGTTMTVELRMYETKSADITDNNTTNEETGEYIVVNSTSYTFAEPEAPVASIETASTDELAAINATKPTIYNSTEIIEIETAYTFKATETAAEAAVSPYADWIADYYVTVDRDIAAGTLGLAGQYDAWSTDWVAFYAPETQANVATPLLGSVSNGITYAELIEMLNGGDFQCGAFDKDGACSGTTMTVELRLTNPNDATDYKVISSTSYTF